MNEDESTDTSGVNWRDHRLDILELQLRQIEKRLDEHQDSIKQLRFDVQSLNERAVFQRSLTPLERQIVSDNVAKTLAKSVERHYAGESDRRRRGRVGLMAAIMGGAGAIGGFIYKLISGIRIH